MLDILGSLSWKQLTDENDKIDKSPAEFGFKTPIVNKQQNAQIFNHIDTRELSREKQKQNKTTKSPPGTSTLSTYTVNLSCCTID